MSNYLSSDALGEIRDKVRSKVHTLVSTSEGVHLSHANDEVAIIELLFRYVVGNKAFEIMILKQYPSLNSSTEHKKVDLNEFGVEIFTTARDVLKAYGEEKGDFFAYFDFAMRNALIRAVGETIWDHQHGGMAMTYGDKQRSISRIIREITAAGEDVDPYQVVSLAGQKGITITPDDVMEYMDSTISGDTPISDEEDSPTLSDLLPDQNSDVPGENARGKGNNLKVLGYIEQAFSRSRSTSSGVLAAVLTAMFSDWIDSNSEELIPTVEKCAWFDRAVFDYYLETGERMEQKAIAERFEKTESSISRTKKKFIERYMDIADLEELLLITRR